VEHDIALCTGAGMALPGTAPFQARFDYIYFTTTALRCVAVRSPLSEHHARQLLVDHAATLPNSWHPSDHLPLAAAFECK